MTSRHIRFTVAPDDAGLRLDQLLAKRVPDLSRRTARKALLVGGVYVERARVKVASKIVQPGRTIDVYLGGTRESASAADAIAVPDLAVLFEDETLLVVDKPSGMPTAATRETDRNHLVYFLGLRPSSPTIHVVHRLDLQTSGLLVFAKTAPAARQLSELFRGHDLERVYRVVLLGDLPEARSVDAPIEGRAARTELRPVEHRQGLTLAEARLETGRTHQIRIHAQAIGHPVAGDRRYGAAPEPQPPRLALHAYVLGFRHPETGQPLRFERHWPSDLATWWEAQPPSRPAAS